MDKKEAQYVHAKKRLLERYNLKYVQHIEDHIRCAVKSGGAELIYKSSKRVCIYDVIYRLKNFDVEDANLVGKLIIIRFVYDHARNSVATFLPRNEADYSKWLWQDDPIF